MAELFVILYSTPVYGRPDVNRLLWNAADFGTSNNPVPWNPHFIGPFNPVRYQPPIVSHPPRDFSFDPGANPHYLGPFAATRYRQPILATPQDFSTPINSESGANPYFIGQFQPTTYKVDISLRHVPAVDLAQHVQANVFEWIIRARRRGRR